MLCLKLIYFLFLVPLIYSDPLVFKFRQQSKYKNEYENEDRERKSENGRSNIKDSKCGYQTCDLGKPDMLNVHMVAHTHDDVGWLKTVDQYYYGARNDIQNAGVQYIIDTVIQELKANPDRKFIYVEIAFFYRWWNEQNEDMKNDVKELVNSGRLEFILGGWCMNDEASTHYNAIIDQHTLGFKFLLDNFGECAVPKIGWQIDPFGHSREQASLFAQFGFDGLFFGRLDYQDKDKRMKNKTAEMMWMASDSLGDAASLLTGVLHDGYGPPPELGWSRGIVPVMGQRISKSEDRKGDAGALFTGVNHDGYGPPAGVGLGDAIMDDHNLEDYNVDDVVKNFVKAAKDQSLNYTTNHIMMTMGSDFQYQNAHQNFKNLDKLIKYVNIKSMENKVNAIYSTPSCYLYALNQANQTYTTKSDDFFPYASRANTFWTGYFTSRPALKGYVRQTNNFLQACKQLDAISGIHSHPELNTYQKVNTLSQAMGVAQHHDAVSGTEKQAVADDYAKRLAHGISECEEVINMAYKKKMPKNFGATAPAQTFCHWANISYCELTMNNSDFTLTLYNPLGRTVTHWVRMAVNGNGYQVLDSTMKSIEAYAITNQPFTWKLGPLFNATISQNVLTFKAELPPLGWATYFATKTGSLEHERYLKSTEQVKKIKQPPPVDFSIQNEHIKLTYSKDDGLLKSITNLDKNITTMVHHELMYYKSFKGNNSKDVFQASGAYVFRPNGTDAEKITKRVDVTQLDSRIMHEMRTDYGNWANTVHRLYKGENFLEIEWTVGPIPFNDGIGKEVISRFVTDLKTDKTFYTDSNGREHLKRVIDYRPTWKLNQTEPIAGNYYPVNSRIVLFDADKNVQLSVVTDRSQGGGSIRDGEMELMLHRRMFVDDAFGVGEALNETGFNGTGLIVRGWQRVFLDTGEASSHLHRDMEERMYMAPITSVAKLDMKPSDYMQKYKALYAGLKKDLPLNVHLLTLEAWDESTYLLRLEHYYEKDSDKNLSQPVSVSLKGLFTGANIISAQEVTLGANQMLSSAKRLSWNVMGWGKTTSDMSSYVTPLDMSTMMVELKPMQIRSFKIRVVPTGN